MSPVALKHHRRAPASDHSGRMFIFPRTTLTRSARSWVPSWSCWDPPAAGSLTGCWPRWTPRWAAASSWPAATSNSCSREAAPRWGFCSILQCRRVCPPAPSAAENTPTTARSPYCSRTMLEDWRYVERGKAGVERGGCRTRTAKWMRWDMRKGERGRSGS